MTTDDGRQVMAKAHMPFGKGSLKRFQNAITLYMGAAINRLLSYVKNTGSVQEPVLVTAYNLKSNVLL